MRGRRRFPKLGTLVAVEWTDITASVNSNLSDAAPAKCETTGRLVKKTDAFIVIATSLFDDLGPDLCGDFVAIPVGVLVAIRRI
jgi:hypothetical protein